jgi:acetamidase/formamidase
MTKNRTHRIEPKIFHYTYGPAEPAVVIRSGDTVVTPTRDAGGRDEKGKPMPEALKAKAPGTSLNQANPLVGPIVVEGAKPGDALAVHIRRIRLNRRTAWSCHIPHFGAFSSGAPGKISSFETPPPAMDWHWDLDLRKNTGTLKLPKSRLKKITIPLHPFIGSIGVAPPYGCVEMSLTPGEYGGNMDCIETQAGTTLYLPVFVEGGHLYLGDIHAAQGDGEVCGVALEATAEVTLEIDLVKDWHIEWPRLEDRTHIMVAGSAKPLWEAFSLAHIQLIEWLEKDYGFDRWEAYQVVSQAGIARVGNVVDPKFTVVAKFPRKYLPKV